MVQFNDNKADAKFDDLRALEEERYVQAMAPRYGFDYIYLRGYTINPEAVALIPEARAREHDLVCFDLNNRDLSVAAKNPADPRVQLLLQELISRKYNLKVFVCSHHSLDHAWSRYKDVVATTAEKKGVFEIDATVISKLMSAIKTTSDVVGQLTNINALNNSRRISETLELIFAGALALKASDIHMEPEQGVVRLRYRLDGVLHDITDLETYIFERLLSRLKLLSGMTLNAKKIAQDGRFTFTAGERPIEMRSSIIPGAIGESIVMRILDPTVASFSIENLQLNEYVLAAIKNEIKKPNGLIITTGPTGSGKTTALYAFLKEAHNEGVKIITIENPVEYKLDGIVQTQVGGDYSFADGLRAILRQDPDIIMVGEIRDREVAETAIHAAQTGHLVFSTLHTNSAAAGFPRLIDLGIDPRMFGTSINAMLGQRLVRILCSECKTAYQADATEQKIIEYVLKDHPYPPTTPNPVTLYKAVGCDACGGSGFKGRAAIFEGIIMDDAVEEAVIRDPREHIIIEAAKPQKIPTMIQDGIAKVTGGVTSLTELQRVVELPSLHTIDSEPVSQSETESDDDFLSHIVI
jgi:type IV pilus assembly protein PilB